MKKALPYFSMFLMSLSLMLIGAEILLRLTGVAEPWIPLAANEPAMFQPDPVLGWKTKPGEFRLGPFSPQGHETHYTFLDDGSRSTSNNNEKSSYDLILVGGSFTEGFAVSDEDTFAWKLQSKFPSFTIGNFGVGGYGTYQSLLLLRELYKRHLKPAIVVYGFLPFHEERNIANSGWRKVLTEFSKRGHSLVPFCSLDENGELVEHKSIGYPVLPLHEHLALVDFTLKFYFKFMDKDESKRRKDGSTITKKLMLAMDNLARENGSLFFVALLEPPQQYASFFETSGIRTIDCRFEPDGDYTVSGEGHPNEKAHAIWAESIAEFLEAQPFFRKSSAQEGNGT